MRRPLLNCFIHRRRMSSNSMRTYAEAVEKLNSLQSNAETIEKARASGGRLEKFAIPETIEYLKRIGYKPADLNKLNVIHVTGTKGKGSTCAFVDSILRQTSPHLKIGLFTSPHLVAVRERIRINNVPITEADFARYFFEVWDRLEANKIRQNPDTLEKPMYFRYVTLVAYHAFLDMKVDATILEVGVGGRYDCTNIVPKPIVTGISALGLDHVAVLGKTLEEIAAQKGGIYKKGVPAFTVEQPESSLAVLKGIAKEVETSSLTVIPEIPASLKSVKLGLSGEHQYQNAILALHLSHSFLSSTKLDIQPLDPTSLPDSYLRGLENARWPGRCQQVADPELSDLTWFVDGAHTVESLAYCAKWFASSETAQRSSRRILIFNCTSGRSGDKFLGTVLQHINEVLEATGSQDRAENFFERVIFCANVTYASGGFKGDLMTRAIAEDDLAYLKTQHELARAWKSLVPSFPDSIVHVLPSIEHAVNIVHGLSKAQDSAEKQVDVLVAGSLHLVGGVIEAAGLAAVML